MENEIKETEEVGAATASLPVEKSSAMGWKLATMALVVLLLASVVVSVWMFTLKHEAEGALNQLKLELVEMDEDLDDDIDIISEQDDSDDEDISQFGDDTDINRFTNDFLSFLYPLDVSITTNRASGGRESYTLDFFSVGTGGALEPTGLTLSFPANDVAEDGSERTISDIRARYEFAFPDIDLETYEVDGKDGLKVVTGGFSGEAFQIFIEYGNDPSDFYIFEGSSSETYSATSILDLFVATAELQ